MRFPSFERPFFLMGPEEAMKEASEKWKNALNQPSFPLPEFDFSEPPLRLQDHKVKLLSVKPLSIPFAKPLKVSVQSPIKDNLPLGRPFAAPLAEKPMEPLTAGIPASSPAEALTEQMSSAQQADISLPENLLTLESQLASLAPVVKQAVKLLQHPRVLGGLFFFGLLGLGYFLKGETIRNIHINVDADPTKKRTYRIALDKDNHPTKIQLSLTPGKPVDIQFHRPQTNEPTVYNIVIKNPAEKGAAGKRKERTNFLAQQIDFGNKQMIRLVDKR